MLTHFCISQQGKRHIVKNVPCQDASASKRITVDRFGCEFVIAAIADGVGSCEYSQVGSTTAVRSFMRSVEYIVQNQLQELSDENIIDLLKFSFNYALSQVESESEKRELPFLEFDSTLTGILYDGHTIWYGHIGDDGAVVLYSDGKYEMITKRHKGEEANSVFPLREVNLWQFGNSLKEVASCVLMTDGVLDYCVDSESMGNRVYFPFLEPALTDPAFTDEDAEKQRLDWDEYLAGKGKYKDNFRDKVSDDISFVVVQNPNLIKSVSPIHFDFDKWDEDTERRKKELDDALYADYRAYKAGTYHSPVKQATGYKSSGTRNDKNTSRNKQRENPNEQIAGSDDAMSNPNGNEGIGVAFDDICTDAAEAIIDVIKTAHGVGRFVRKQFPSKRKRNITPRGQLVTDSNETSKKKCSKSDASIAKPKAQTQGKIAIDDEETTETNTDE